jgi:ferrous iron transport protein A
LILSFNYWTRQAVNPIIPLQLLQSGETGEVVEVLGDERLVARLAESGLRAGCRLEMLSHGDPCVCRVDDTRLSFRTDGLVEVLIRLAH